jgi:RNA polymerase sigma factor (TIGR02999 family)
MTTFLRKCNSVMNDITEILKGVDSGDPEAASQLLPLVYGELRQLAAAQMAQEKPGHTLDATALVHEAYLRLVRPSRGVSGAERAFANRRHFFAAAAEAMRRILVENARRKRRRKHGGDRRRLHVDLDAVAGASADELLALHDALEQFAAHDPLKARLVELRFFGGLTLAEAAEHLGISLSTADRAWRYARAWLYAAMDGKK